MVKTKAKTMHEKAIGYYYYKEIPMVVNDEVVMIKVKKYKKPSLAAQKKVLKW